MSEDEQTRDQQPSALNVRLTTVPVSFKISIFGKELLQYLAVREGMNTTAYLEMVLRQKGREAGLDLDALNSTINYPTMRNLPSERPNAANKRQAEENDAIESREAEQPPPHPPSK